MKRALLCSIVLCLVGVAAPAARAEYVRLPIAPVEAGGLPATFDDLLQRVEGAGLTPVAQYPPTWSQYVATNASGFYGSMSFSDGNDYVDVGWYEFDDLSAAELFADTYISSYYGYGPGYTGPMPMLERSDTRVVIISSGSYDVLYERLVAAILRGR
jgi:hypothetical protein